LSLYNFKGHILSVCELRLYLNSYLC